MPGFFSRLPLTLFDALRKKVAVFKKASGQRYPANHSFSIFSINRKGRPLPPIVLILSPAMESKLSETQSSLLSILMQHFSSFFKAENGTHDSFKYTCMSQQPSGRVVYSSLRMTVLGFFSRCIEICFFCLLVEKLFCLRRKWGNFIVRPFSYLCNTDFLYNSRLISHLTILSPGLAADNRYAPIEKSRFALFSFSLR